MALDPRRLTLLPEPLKNWFLNAIDPVADGLMRAGLTPNRITTLSIFVLFASGAAFGMDHLRTGSILLLLSGFFDLLDGKVARRGGMSTKFGAFYDSTMDRLGEGALFAGIGIFYTRSLIYGGDIRLPILGLGLAFAALTGAFLVSYTRARAEGLGLEAKVGMAQRAERIVFLGVPTMFFGAGPRGLLLLGILAWLTVISWITVVQRILYVQKATQAADAEVMARVPAAHPVKGA
jgi:CDP-diacylglycerol--glycerol-3-phosphate 3-phosphatidyltransferase